VEKRLNSTPSVPTSKTEPIVSSSKEGDVAVLVAEEKPVRKRLTRKTSDTDSGLSLGLDLPSTDTPRFAPEVTTPVVSPDGFTRLLVTAYIGIGNKLFVRGEGPGLSWDQGVPLQFVSIGKWRWESAEATAAVTLKLYKNDEFECTTVGAVELQPGHQQEVTASFG